MYRRAPQGDDPRVAPSFSEISDHRLSAQPMTLPWGSTLNISLHHKVTGGGMSLIHLGGTRSRAKNNNLSNNLSLWEESDQLFRGYISRKTAGSFLILALKRHLKSLKLSSSRTWRYTCIYIYIYSVLSMQDPILSSSSLLPDSEVNSLLAWNCITEGEIMGFYTISNSCSGS